MPLWKACQRKNGPQSGNNCVANLTPCLTKKKRRFGISALHNVMNRPLKDLVLRGWYSDRSIFLLILGHIGALDGRSPIGPVHRTLLQIPQIIHEIRPILSDGLAINSEGGVLTQAPEGFCHPVQVHVMVQRNQRLMPVPLRRQHYPLSSG